MNRQKKSNYIILVLVCLIMLNTGTILIKTYYSREDKEIFNNVEKRKISSQWLIPILGRTSSIISFYQNQDYNERFNLKDIIKEKIYSISSLDFLKKEDNNDKEMLEEDNEENDELHTTVLEDQVIIDRLDEYESLIIVKDSEGKSSVESIPEPLNIKKMKINKEKPYILLYHTHGTEAYLPIKDSQYHTTEKKYNVVTIGEIMTKILEANGHKVDHVETYHDLPSYNKSYSRSLNTVNKKMEEEKNLKVFLDVHRDGIGDDANYRERALSKAKTKINGVDVATFSIVVGPDSPNKEQVLSFAKYIKAVSDTLYPNLCTGIIIKPKGKYNQFVSDYSALIEVGSNLNTIEEASESAKLIGEILTLVLDSIRE